MFADVETGCRVYHVCYPEERRGSFFCGEGTVFNQKLLTCDYPQNTDCANSERYWSANEDFGKPGAEPTPGQNARPASPSKTRQSSWSQGSRPSRPQYQTGFQPSSYPQQPVKQYKQQPSYQPQQQFQQQPQRPSYNAYAADDSGFVSEPVKKIRPTYKVIKTQQAFSGHQTKPHLSPAKAKVVQKAVPIDDLQQQQQVNQVSDNYGESYQPSDSYFSQQQTSGWQPSSGPAKQGGQPNYSQQQSESPGSYRPSSSGGQQNYPQQQSESPGSYRPSSSGGQQNYPQQQSESTGSYRPSSSGGQQYSQQSNAKSGWRAGSQPGGGFSSNDINSQKIDLNIPQTNFKCEGLPYEPGK